MAQRMVSSPAQPSDRRSSRWEGHRAARRSELVAAAVRAIDRDGPETSMSSIAAEAGVSKPVLYRYFTDKDELHAAVGRWGADEVLARIVPEFSTQAPVRDRVGRAVDAYLRVIEEHQQVFLLLVRHRAEGDPLADGKAAIAAAIARVLGDTMRDLDLDAGGAEPWAQSIVGLGLTTGEWWLGRRTMSRRTVGGYLTSFVWHAIEGTSTELGVPISSLDTPRSVRRLPTPPATSS